MAISNDSLGDRMKVYEQQETSRHFIPRLPIIVRIDGKNFHTYTRKMAKPVDSNLQKAMCAATKALILESNAIIGYTQSDEITLLLPDDKPVYFESRIFKLTSVLASIATMEFNRNMPPDKQYATFDCRVFQVPNRYEAINCLIWRQMDAVKNSVSALAQVYFSHKQLNHVNTSGKIELLKELHNVDWHSYSPYFRQGSFFKKEVVQRKFTADELKNLPSKHEAHKNPDMLVTRNEFKEVYTDFLLKDKDNRMELIYGTNNLTDFLKS